MGGQRKAYKGEIDTEKGLRHLSRFLDNHRDLRDPGKLHELVLDLYDLMLRILEDESFAERAAAIANKERVELIGRIEDIIDILLFNNMGNPYVSLGLPEYADKTTAKERWKRLITLFHPDKYQNQAVYEERSKRINEAYRELSDFKKPSRDGSAQYRNFDSGRWRQYQYSRAGTRPASKGASGRENIFRHLPLIVISLSLVISIITITLFVIRIRSNSSQDIDVSVSYPSSEQTRVIEGNEKKKTVTERQKPLLREPAEAKADFNITELETFSVASFDKSPPGNPSQDAGIPASAEKTGSEDLLASGIKRPPATNLSGDASTDKISKANTVTEEDVNITPKPPGKTEKESQMPPAEEKVETAKLPASLDSGDMKPAAVRESAPVKSKPRYFSDEEIIEEINHRLYSFVDYYEEGDLEKYLSLFSTDAMENGEPVRELVETYRASFDDVRNKLTLSNIFIRINSKDNVLVSADYSLNRFDIKNIEYKRYEGKMQWEFKKEGKVFLIKRLDYDRN